MKVNLVDVVEKTVQYSDRDHLVVMMGQGMWELNHVVVKDYNREYEVKPGDCLKMWWHPNHRKTKIGGSFIYFAPAVLDDLHILGVKTPGNGRKNVKPKETIVIPEGLTLENHAEAMGSRFRMTKLEREKFGKDRGEAFKTRYNRHPVTGEKI
jgi:hypothetical protein